MGKNLYSEIADADKDYKKASLRRTKDAAVDEYDGGGETPYEYFRKKSRGGSKKTSKKRR